MKTNNRLLRVFTILIACCFTTIGFSQTDEEIEEQEQQEVRVSYMNYLHEQGYKPEVDNDGDVKFKSEGKTYYLLVNSPRVFQVARYLSVDNTCENKFLKALSQVNRRFLNITAFAAKDCEGFSVSSRSWIDEPDDWKDIFNFSLITVRKAVISTYKYYAEE